MYGESVQSLHRVSRMCGTVSRLCEESIQALFGESVQIVWKKYPECENRLLIVYGEKIQIV